MPTRRTVVLVSLLLATPVVISWLWLVFLPLRVIALCPEECRCDVGGYRVDCTNQSLCKFPSVSITHVQELDLNDNNITSLQKDIFVSQELTELYMLSLDRCGLQTIELGAFNGLTKLEVLSMRENGIGEITRRTFEGMSGLIYLGLGYNEIEHLGVDVFLELVNLQHINLEGNKLLEIHPDTFVGLPNLESLDLSANEGLQIPTERHLITSYSLKFLSIQMCNVSSVSVQTFAKVSELEFLDLRYNKLSSFDINIFRSLPKLYDLYLTYNPLRRDCQLKEVRRWCWELYEHSHLIVKENERLSRFLGHLMWPCELPKLQCVQNNIRNKSEYEQKHYKYLNDENESTRTRVILLLVLASVHLFLSIFGTIGNVIILIIITCNNDMRTVSNMYILNLAISDLIFLTLPFVDVTHMVLSGVEEDELRCNFFPFCHRMSVGLSAYSVAVLSIQRYRITANPFHVRVSSQPTWRVTVSTICGLWIVVALLAVPSAFSSFVCPVRLIESRSLFFYKHVFTYELLVFCVLPLCVTAFFYIVTARHLVKSADIVSEETQNPQMNKRKNVAKYVIGLTLVFLISYVPYHVLGAYFVFISDWENYLRHFDSLVTNHSISLIIMSSYCFFLMNSALNPVALFCTSSLFRNHLKRYLCCCCKANSPPTDIVHTRRN